MQEAQEPAQEERSRVMKAQCTRDGSGGLAERPHDLLKRHDHKTQWRSHRLKKGSAYLI